MIDADVAKILRAPQAVDHPLPALTAPLPQIRLRRVAGESTSNG